MAKIRRIIRKLDKPHDSALDEQSWPVYVALVVLGGFSLGTTLAYLQFGDPRWWADAWLYVVMIPLIVAGAMIAFRYINNRAFRRSMQLALVLSAIVHVGLVILSAESIIFTSLDLSKGKSPISDRRAPAPVQITELLMAEQPDEPRDFEKPVETETPEITVDPSPDKEEVEATAPRRPQPVPVPEPQRTQQPALVKRPTAEQATPREAPTTGKLSRNMQPRELSPAGSKVEAERPREQPGEAKIAAATSSVQRQTTETRPTERAADKDPSATEPQAVASVAKKTDEVAPQPETAATATLKRQVNEPAVTPRSQVDVADAPAIAKRTSPTEPTPNNTATTKVDNASPQTKRPESDPTTEPTTQVATANNKRELESQPEPTIAAAPTTIASRQPRVTPRPTAAVVNPTSPTVSVSRQPTVPSPRSTTVARVQSSVTAEKASRTEPSAAPNLPDITKVAARTTRTDSRPVPDDPSLGAAANSPARRTGTPGVPAPAAKAESVAGAESAASSVELSAQAVSSRKSESASPAAGLSGTPAPETIAATAPAATPTSTPSRATATGVPSPNLGQVASSTTGRATASSAPNVVTRVANVEATSGPTTASTLTAGAAAATASKQETASSGAATRTQPSLEVAASGVGSPLASGATRAATNSSPSITPATPATGSPQRATRSAQLAASPASVESPAGSPGASSTAEASAEPARLALSRGESGVAGTGNSPNLDRGSAAGDSPAMVASVAARRAQATTLGPADASLNPSSATTRAHSRAGAASPTSSLVAEEGPNSTQGGAPQPGELASASATVSKAAGNAAPGEVSAAKGTAELDTGANTIVAESGRARAGGGGQPEMSSDPQSGKLTRQQPGGSPSASLTADKIAALPEAPMATGGGEAGSLDPAQTLAARGDATAGSTGGPTKADEKGPLTEPSAASLLAQAVASRADASEGGAPGSGGGTPDLEDEEEKAKRLARAALGGSPALSTAADRITDVPAAPTGDGGSGGSLASGEAAPTNTAATRGASAGGALASGALPAPGDGAPPSGTAGSATIARAEAASAAPSPTTLAGGGTGAPAKATAGQTIVTNTQAEKVELAGAPESAGGPDGAALQAQGIEAAKTSGGAAGKIAEGTTGAKAGDEVVVADGPQGVGAVAGAARSVSPATADGPDISGVVTGAPGKRSKETNFAGGDAGKIEVPLVGPTSAVAQADLDHGMVGGIGRTASDAGEGLEVDLEAPDGPGGLGNIAAADVGLNSRLARADGLEISSQPTRLLGRRNGGIPAISTASAVPTDSFKKRGEGRSGRGSLPPQTEEAIERGLMFIARVQQEDGSWRLQGLEQNSRADAQMVSDTAATALAVLAFQGAGYNHREHKYATIVRNGLDHLVQNQKENGDLFVPLDDKSNQSVWLYSHALASLALCEAYGMTQDPALKEPAQKSLDFIIAGQHKQRGGWRYVPGVDSDTSVTGAMLVALRSGELAGLNVPKSTYEGVSKWLDQSQASTSQPHLYRYNPYAADNPAQRHGRVASPTMTSLGLLCRLYLGWKRSDPNVVHGADYLKEHLPALGTNTSPQRDTYYWYYATQVMWHMGGDHWKEWNDKLHKLLVDSQIKEGGYAGSWNPRLPVADRWGPHGGRLYVTALNLLSLEVQHRYLPVYEDLAK